MGEYQPWVHSSGVPSVELEDLDVEIKDNTYDGKPAKFGYLKPQYDWGLYNGSRGSNPDNPNATGLYTYEGRELQGQWRTMKIEEILYLVGIPCLDNSYPITDYYLGQDTKNYNAIFDPYDMYSFGQKTGGYFLFPTQGRALNDTYIPNPDNLQMSQFLRQNDITSYVYRYDYSEHNWVPYRFEYWVELDNSGNPDDYYEFEHNYMRPILSDSDYQVLNSKRYDTDGNPQYATVTIIDKATLKTEVYTAILPDDWKDPCKNESSADGKIVKGSASTTMNTNIYTKERWKFFMEPSGAVLLHDSGFDSLDDLSLAFCHSRKTFTGISRVFWEISWEAPSVKGKHVPYVQVLGDGTPGGGSTNVRLVQDAN